MVEIWKSVKVYIIFAFMKTKTLKISEHVHKELKVYVASSGVNMTVFADAAIINLLAAKGHKSSKKQSTIKK